MGLDVTSSPSSLLVPASSPSTTSITAPTVSAVNQQNQPSLTNNTAFQSITTATTSNTRSFHHIVSTVVWPGLGLLGESYILFSIGTLHPLWEYIILYTAASNTSDTESLRLLTLLSQLPYLTCASIMFGMILFGIYTNQYGRRYGSIGTASFMLGGCALMTFIAIPNILHNVIGNHTQSSMTSTIWWHVFVIGMVVFAFGVGGEYPVAAASATERSMTLRAQPPPQHDHHHKSGRHIQLIFTMQGVGIFLQVVLLTTLIYILHLHMRKVEIYDNNGQVNNVYTSSLARGYTLIWMVLYSFGTLILFLVFVTRLLLLQESAIWKLQKQEHHHKDSSNSGNILYHCPPIMRSESIQPSPIRATEPLFALPTASNMNASSVYLCTAQQSENSCRAKTIDKGNTDNISDTDEKKNMSAHSGSGNNADHNASATNVHKNIHSDTLHLRRDDHESHQRKIADIHWTVLVKVCLFHSQYGIRLASVSLSWFLWDVAFYGNKLFQSTFLFALTNRNGKTTADNGDYYDSSKYGIESLLQLSMAATINASIALCGYYVAACIIDHPLIGRRKLQLYGFILTGLLFIGVGWLYDTISTNLLIFLYFGTSFFGQCGPNATTFILPSEVFPTQLRTICHGVAAASGKLGALIATIVFHRIANDVDLFLLSGYTSFIAAATTFWFIPETLGHDLRENDRHWEHIISSYIEHSAYSDMHNGDYSQNPLYLSVYEQRRQNWKKNNVDDTAYNKCDDVFAFS